MKLYFAALSPFVRKVARGGDGARARQEDRAGDGGEHAGGDERRSRARSNPLGKLPTLVTDDGDLLDRIER